MIKYLLVGILLLSSTCLNAEMLRKSTNKQGDVLISVFNDTANHLTCQIWNVTYFVDFTIAPNTSSRWYVEPINEYEWECY